MDKKDGTILWCNSIYPDILEKYHSISDAAPATIAVDADGIFVYFASHGIRCLDHKGNVIWDYPITVLDFRWGHASSPIIVDDKIIISLDYGDEKGQLLALDKKTGNVVWKILIQENTPFDHVGKPGYSTPIRYQEQIIIHRHGGIASYSGHNGSPVWWIDITTNGISTPIIYDDKIYVGTWMELTEEERRGEYFNYDTFEKVLDNFDINKDKLISKDEIPEDLLITSRPDNDIEDAMSFQLVNLFNYFDSNKNGYLDENEWTETYDLWSSFELNFGLMALNPNLKGKLDLEDILWMQPEKTPEVPSPVAIDDCIYMVKNGGWLTCMDAEKGKVYYQEKIGSSGAYIASPVFANNHIYLSSYNGTVKVIKAGKIPSAVHQTRLDGKITATPAISMNNLYIRTSKYLYAFANQ